MPGFNVKNNNSHQILEYFLYHRYQVVSLDRQGHTKCSTSQSLDSTRNRSKWSNLDKTLWQFSGSRTAQKDNPARGYQMFWKWIPQKCLIRIPTIKSKENHILTMLMLYYDSLIWLYSKKVLTPFSDVKLKHE